MDVDNAMECCIEALLDAETLSRFPSSNLDFVKSIGGERSAKKEQSRLAKLLEAKQSENVGDTSYTDPDAVGIRKRKGDIFDAPGASYMSRRLWSFCGNLGALMAEFSRSEQQAETAMSRPTMMQVATALLQSDIKLMTVSKAQIFDGLTLGSLEREGLKRVVVMCSILRASATFSSLVIYSLLDQIDAIASGVLYYERNSSQEVLQEYAKARSLQHLYINFGMTIFAFLLRDINSDKSAEQSAFLWNHVIVPSLRLQRIAAPSSFDVKPLRAFSQDRSNMLYLPSSQNSTAMRPKSLCEDLFNGVGRRLKELVLYCASDENESVTKRNFYALLESIVPHESLATIFSTGATEESASDVNASTFLRSVDSFLSVMEPSKDYRLKGFIAVSNFRHFAVRDFLLPKLKYPSISIEEKVTLMRLLLRVASNGITFNPKSAGDEDLQDDVYEVAKTTSSLLHRGIECLDTCADLLEVVFRCATCLLTLEVQNENQLLFSWCKGIAPPLQNKAAKYFLVVFNTIYVTANLITSSTYAMFYSLYWKMKEDGFLFNDSTLDESFVSDELRRWCLLVRERLALESSTLQLPRQSVNSNNPYSKITRQSPSTHRGVPTLSAASIYAAKNYTEAYLRLGGGNLTQTYINQREE